MALQEFDRPEASGREAEQPAAFLLSLSDNICALADAGAIAMTAASLVAAHFRADRCCIARLSPKTRRASLDHEYRRPHLEPLSGAHRYFGLPESAEGHPLEPLAFNDVQNDHRLSDGDKASLRAMEIGAYAAAMLRKAEQESIPVLVVATCDKRDWLSAELQLLENVAGRVGVAMERARDEAASEERIRKLLALMPAAVYTCDAEGRLTSFNPRAVELWGREPRLGDPLEKFCGSFRMWLPNGAVLRHEECPMADAVREGRAARNLEVVIEQPTGSRIVVSVNIDPLYDSEGRLIGAINVFRDITESKQASELQALLTAELQHRVRNILATVRAIATRTEAASGSIDEFKAHLDGRISALARTQTVLARSPGEAADLEMLIRDELLAQAAQDWRFSIAGPPLRLSPKAAEVTTLALHELATNSTKYGALAHHNGRVAVEWHIDCRSDIPWLTLTWTESGLSLPDSTPQHIGFGTEMLTRRIPYELHGTGAMEMRATGLRAEIAFPLERKQGAARLASS